MRSSLMWTCGVLAVIAAMALGACEPDGEAGADEQGGADGADAEEASEREPLRTFVLKQSAGFRHGVVTPNDDGRTVVQEVFEGLAEQTGELEPTFSFDVRELTEEVLAETDLVVFYTTGDLPVAEGQKQMLEQWLSDGGLVMGVHPATDTFHDDELWVNIMGGTFDGHPWNAGDTVTIKVQDAEHPAAEPYAPEATFQEEIYQFRNFDPERVRVLMSLDMEQTEKKRPYHVPIAWVQEYGEDGRVFYTSLGHNEHIWRSDEYQAHLIGAIRWLAGWEEGSAEPNPDVHERENEIAERAAGG